MTKTMDSTQEKYIYFCFEGKIVGLDVRLDIVNEGGRGTKGESMQQEEFQGAGWK